MGFARGRHVVRAEPRVRELPLEAVALLGEGKVSEAMKLLRQSEGLSRSEARRRIDAHFERDPMLRVQIEARQSARRRRFFYWFLLVDIAITAGVIYWFFYRGPA
jgi:hypothetical protein